MLMDCEWSKNEVTLVSVSVVIVSETEEAHVLNTKANTSDDILNLALKM